MQLLIDTSTESITDLEFAAETLLRLARLRGEQAPPAILPSINGPSEPVDLTDTVTVPEVTDPVIAFGVPTGTTVTPFTLPTAIAATPVAPPAPGVLTVSVPPANTTAPTNVSPVMTTEVGTVDNNGQPWNAAVHSDSKALNADGTWRFRRNLDATVKANYLATIAANPLDPYRYSTPAPPAATATAPVGLSVEPIGATVPPVASPTVPVSLPVPPTAALPVPPAIPMGLPVPPVSPVLPANNFRELMNKIATAQNAGRLTREQVNLACKTVGVDDVTMLVQHPGKVPLVDSQINALLV